MSDNHPHFVRRDPTLSRRAFLATWALPLVGADTARAATETTPASYTRDEFEHAGVCLELWTRGSGPLVFVLHEMNGLTPKCFELGDDLVATGFSVAIPKFFGGRGGAFLGYFKACGLGSLFTCYESFDYGKVTPWLRALALYKSGDGNFGAIGNCMTGVLPLVMLRSRRCVAPVLCQPAYPLRSALFDDHASSLGLSQVDLEFAALRSERDSVPVLAIRYERDGLCPPRRFTMLRDLLKSNFHCVQLAGKGHSTLITHRSMAAFDHVVAFLRHRLTGAAWQPPTGADTPGECAEVDTGHGGR